MAELTCIVVTPEQTALAETVSFVALPLYDGEIGVAPGHRPMIGRLGYGEMRLRRGPEVTRYYLDGGFVQVADDVISVLTSRAVPADRIEIDVARQRLQQAVKKPAHTSELLEIRDREITQARAQISVARRQQQHS
jgi:F-type H+-transporting ATPase subunit epsilon